mgnify:CR=1 FL=1
MKAADLFAGAGGFSTGARLAGVPVVWAANHWPAAVRVHARNHPDTVHACQDLQQANWATVPAHDLLLASPCCQAQPRTRQERRQPKTRRQPGHRLGRGQRVGVSPPCGGSYRERERK